MSNNLAYDDFEQKRRQELIDGAAVMMSPRPSFNHNRIAENIDFIFRTYLRGGPCIPLGDGYDLYLNEKNRFVPDMMVVCDWNKIKPDGVHGAPDLVVEVLSISTAKNDRGAKKNAYEKAGVQEYWIVNPADKSVEQYLLVNGQLELNEVYAIHPDDMLETMTEEEKAAIVTHFQCSLFDDLDIALEDIFYRIL